MKPLITSFIFLIFSLTHLFGQIEEAPVVEEVPDVEIMEMEADPEVVDYSYPPPPPPAQIEYSDASRKSYQYQKINENYSYYFKGTSAYISYNTKVGIMKDGKSIVPMIFTKVSNSGSDVILSLGKKVGIYSIETDKWIVPIEYMSIRSVLNGYYAAQVSQQEIIIINNENRQISSESFRSAYNLTGYDNYLRITNQNNLHGVYNIVKNDYLIPPIYKTLVPHQNIFVVQNENSQKNIIDFNNKLLFDTWYDNVVPTRSSRDYFLVNKNGKYGFLNKANEVIVPLDYNFINYSAYSDGSYLAKNSEGKYGTILEDGTETLPFKYETIENTANYGNHKIVSSDGQCGIIAFNEGKPFELTKCDYDLITKQNNTFVVSENGKYGILNSYGELQGKIDYDFINVIPKSYSQNQLIIVAKKGKYFLLDSGFSRLSQEDFDEIKPLYISPNSYSQKIQSLAVNDGKKWQLLDLVGNKLTDKSFDDVLGTLDNKYLVKNDNLIYVFDLIANKTISEGYNQIIKDEESGKIIGEKNGDFYFVATDSASKDQLIKY